MFLKSKGFVKTVTIAAAVLSVGIWGGCSRHKLNFNENVATPIATTTEWSTSPDYTRGNEFRARCLNARGTLSYNSQNKSYSCKNIPVDLSHLPSLGTARSAEECRTMAVQANYRSYHYNTRNRGCFVDGKYEYIGDSDTGRECVALAEYSGFRRALYSSQTKRCFGAQ